MSQCHGNYINPMSSGTGVLNVYRNYINPMSLRQGVPMSWELYESHVTETRCLNVMGII